MLNVIKWYNNIEIQSYNAIFNFIIAIRNNGKTTSFKIRSLRRFLKRGKKTIWVRRFTKEIKQTKKSFYTDKILKLCKVDKSCIYIKGNYVYYKDDKINDWFIQFVPLSSQQDEKSNEDENVDTMVYDEFTATQSRLKRYRGNEVNDFLDLWYSKKRWHRVYCYFIGNKEQITSPYFNYFNIDIPEDFEGFKTFKDGTIVVHQINNINEIKKQQQNDFNDKVDTLLSGTAYAGYLFNGDYKNINKSLIKKTPSRAYMYRCFNVNGVELSLYRLDSNIYVKRGIDKNKQVLSLEPLKQYKNNYVLHHQDIKYMEDLRTAYKFNSLFYNDATAQEAFADVLKLFNLI